MVGCAHDDDGNLASVARHGDGVTEEAVTAKEYDGWGNMKHDPDDGPRQCC